MTSRRWSAASKLSSSGHRFRVSSSGVTTSLAGHSMLSASNDSNGAHASAPSTGISEACPRSAISTSPTTSRWSVESPAPSELSSLRTGSALQQSPAPQLLRLLHDIEVPTPTDDMLTLDCSTAPTPNIPSASAGAGSESANTGMSAIMPFPTASGSEVTRFGVTGDMETDEHTRIVSGRESDASPSFGSFPCPAGTSSEESTTAGVVGASGLGGTAVRVGVVFCALSFLALPVCASALAAEAVAAWGVFCTGFADFEASRFARRCAKARTCFSVLVPTDAAIRRHDLGPCSFAPARNRSISSVVQSLGRTGVEVAVV